MKEIFEIKVHENKSGKGRGKVVCVYGERVKKCPGLAVTQSYWHMLEGKKRFSLTHIRSGKVLLGEGRFISKRAAVIIAGKELKEVDWERGEEELKEIGEGVLAMQRANKELVKRGK